MNRPTCGYTGHICDTWGDNVQFISRYRDSNDYCVGGKRVSVSDDGVCNGTVEQFEKIRAFETNKYSDYIIWHDKQGLSPATVQPFTFPIEVRYV